MNDLVHPKRANAVDTEDPIGKKPKVTPSLEENSGEKGSHDVHVSEENKPAPVEENSLKIFNSGGSVTQDSRENSPKDMSHDLGALDQRNSELSIIEAYAAEDKGSRHSMEDAWVVLPDASMEFPGPLRCAHFAIYDGHGGRLAAEYAQKHLHENVLSAGLPRELMDIKAAKKAIFEGFQQTDESLLRKSAAGGWQDGATAVCLWVLGQTVLIANVGDAKAVLARSSDSSPTDGSNGVPNEKSSMLKAIVITREHKAIYPKERARIQKSTQVFNTSMQEQRGAISENPLGVGDLPPLSSLEVVFFYRRLGKGWTSHRATSPPRLRIYIWFLARMVEGVFLLGGARNSVVARSSAKTEYRAMA